MRKFLFALCLLAASLGAAAADLPAVAALKAFRAPMETIVAESGKGPQADFDALAKAWSDADAAWKQFVAEPLDLDRYGVPAARHEDTWRRVRMMVMLVRSLDEGVRRGNLSLIRHAAGMLPQAYADLRLALEPR